ncbi:MAG: nuclear transport factor 2 family protein [Thermoleophilia bacterium]
MTGAELMLAAITAYNDRDEMAFASRMAPRIAYRDPMLPGDLIGRERMLAEVFGRLRMFEDLRFEIDRVVDAGEFVFATGR